MDVWPLWRHVPSLVQRWRVRSARLLMRSGVVPGIGRVQPKDATTEVNDAQDRPSDEGPWEAFNSPFEPLLDELRMLRLTEEQAKPVQEAYDELFPKVAALYELVKELADDNVTPFDEVGSEWLEKARAVIKDLDD